MQDAQRRKFVEGESSNRAGMSVLSLLEVWKPVQSEVRGYEDLKRESLIS
jgi:hypothetical protein